MFEIYIFYRSSERIRDGMWRLPFNLGNVSGKYLLKCMLSRMKCYKIHRFIYDVLRYRMFLITRTIHVRSPIRKSKCCFRLFSIHATRPNYYVFEEKRTVISLI